MSYMSGPGVGETVDISRMGAPEMVPIEVQKAPGQTEPLLRCVDTDGLTTLMEIGADGSISGGASLAGAVALDPSGSSRNVVTPSSDAVTALSVRGLDANNSVPLFEVGIPTDTAILGVDPSANTLGAAVYISGVNNNAQALFVQSALSPSGAVAAFAAPNSPGTFGSVTTVGSTSGGIGYYLATSVASDIEKTAEIDPVWLVNTSGSQAGGLSLRGYDSGGTAHEFLQGGYGGVSVEIGFLGAIPVSRQIGASAAAIAAIVDPNVKSAISALQTALAALGLVTSPS